MKACVGVRLLSVSFRGSRREIVGFGHMATLSSPSGVVWPDKPAGARFDQSV